MHAPFTYSYKCKYLIKYIPLSISFFMPGKKTFPSIFYITNFYDVFFYALYNKSLLYPNNLNILFFFYVVKG